MNLLRAKRVAEKLDMSLRGFYKLTSTNKEFPKPYRLGTNHVAWSDTDVNQWIATMKEGADET